MLIGTDFLWKAVQVGTLKRMLEELSDDDWVYADRNGDLAVIRSEAFDRQKNAAYPGDSVIDFVAETTVEKKPSS